jgi:hypothetical protein
VGLGWPVYGRPEVATYTPAASNPRFSHLRAHLGVYLVGVGATAALTAGALVVFLSLATFLAFHGLPFGGSSDDAGAAYLDSNTGAAPTATAALGAARGAVAKNAAPGPREAGRAARSAAAAGSGSGGSGSDGADQSASGRSESGVSTAPGDITPPAVAIPSLPSTSGPATDAVQGVDNAAGTNLSGSTGGVTRTADGEVSGALNRAAGVAGRGGLGGQAGGASRELTGAD